MTEKRYIKVEIISDKNECGLNCEFNDSGQYCQLFSKPIGNSEEYNIRCDDCIKSEIKE